MVQGLKSRDEEGSIDKCGPDAVHGAVHDPLRTKLGVQPTIEHVQVGVVLVRHLCQRVVHVLVTCDDPLVERLLPGGRDKVLINGVLDILVVRGDDLGSVAPVDFVAVVTLGIVASRDHYPTAGPFLSHGERHPGRGSDPGEEVDLIAQASKDPRRQTGPAL